MTPEEKQSSAQRAAEEMFRKGFFTGHQGAFVLGAKWQAAQVAEAVGNLQAHRDWLQECNDAAFSNMEGCDLKEFQYWEAWFGNTAKQLRAFDAALALLKKEGTK